MYNPTTWVDGDIPTATRMNHLENGVSDLYGTIITDFNGDGFTWRAINEAMLSGRIVVLQDGNNHNSVVLYTYVSNDLFGIWVNTVDGMMNYYSLSPDATLHVGLIYD